MASNKEEPPSGVTAEEIPVLLVTANVGSVFEDVSSVPKVL